VKIDTNNSTKMIIKKCSFQHKYTYDGYHYKTSFPIVLAYAMTSHKSHGATIARKVISDIKEAFALDVTYVMLSRVTN
jgi:ATP-dependent exoDNAse (exonuclease V) alpha subunit